MKNILMGETLRAYPRYIPLLVRRQGEKMNTFEGEGDTKDYIIRVSQSALIQMCLSGLESYIVAHRDSKSPKGRKELETFGLLWGHSISMPENKIMHCVEFMSVDTSAVREKGSVEPNDDALELKRDMMRSFWPQYEFLGDFHTHPCKHYSVVTSSEYEFSPADFESIEGNSDYYMANNYRVGMVMTIARMRKKSSLNPRYVSNSTIQFALGNFKIWLKGYVAVVVEGKLKLNRDDTNVTLDCPALLGLKGEYVQFGRIIEKKNHRIKYKSGN